MVYYYLGKPTGVKGNLPQILLYWVSQYNFSSLSSFFAHLRPHLWVEEIFISDICVLEAMNIPSG